MSITCSFGISRYISNWTLWTINELQFIPSLIKCTKELQTYNFTNFLTEMLTCTIQFSFTFRISPSFFLIYSHFFLFTCSNSLKRPNSFGAIGICMPVCCVFFLFPLLSCFTYLLLSQRNAIRFLHKSEKGVWCSCWLRFMCSLWEKLWPKRKCLDGIVLCKLTRFPHANSIDNSIVFQFLVFFALFSDTAFSYARSTFPTSI